MGAARVADFGLMTITDLTTTFLSETDGSPGGTYCRMSPELLDPKTFSSSGRSTRESDCYALGMLIYEVSTGLNALVPLLHTPGLDWPATLPSRTCLHAHSSHTERGTPRETPSRRIFRVLRCPVGIGTVVLERNELDSTDCPGTT